MVATVGKNGCYNSGIVRQIERTGRMLSTIEVKRVRSAQLNVEFLGSWTGGVNNSPNVKKKVAAPQPTSECENLHPDVHSPNRILL